MSTKEEKSVEEQIAIIVCKDCPAYGSCPDMRDGGDLFCGGEQATHILAIPNIARGLELANMEKLGKLAELVEVQDDGSCYTVADAMDLHEALVKPLVSGK